MAYIYKCVGHGCPIASECYRYLAPVTPNWQAFFVHVPYDHATKECEMYIDNTKETNEPK